MVVRVRNEMIVRSVGSGPGGGAGGGEWLLAAAVGGGFDLLSLSFSLPIPSQKQEKLRKRLHGDSSAHLPKVLQSRQFQNGDDSKSRLRHHPAGTYGRVSGSTDSYRRRRAR